MAQYLLNATAIWLISLLMYDLFLRRESYHSYNRFYLLFSFLLGALLPLWSWPDSSMIIHTGTLQKPIERVITAKQNMVSSAVPDTTIGWQQWLTIIYLAGVLIAVCLLCADIIKLLSYYHSGKKSKHNTWTVIETGKEHAPFSFLNLLFVNSVQQYNAAEWVMILDHEKRHTHLLHFADLLLMQLARIMFWFHPLVYIYNKRLLMVHEFQADHVSAAQPQAYGQFLVEQALLQSAPALSHSFNRSPIKKRIVMLTRKSSTAAKTKMLVFIPLAVICTLFFSQNSFSKKIERHGNIVTYNGNKFEFHHPPTDTMIMLDPVTGKPITKLVTIDPYPAKMNGQKIYTDNDIDDIAKNAKLGDPASVVAGIDDKGLREYLLSSLKNELKNLPDNDYAIEINNIVLDDKGKVVYYEVGGITATKKVDKMGLPKTDKSTISEATQQKISEKINELLTDAPSHQPAYYKGDPVPYRIGSIGIWNTFTIKNGVITAE